MYKSNRLFGRGREGSREILSHGKRVEGYNHNEWSSKSDKEPDKARVCVSPWIESRERLRRRYSSKGIESGEENKSKEDQPHTVSCGLRNQQIYTANQDGVSDSESGEGGGGEEMVVPTTTLTINTTYLKRAPKCRTRRGTDGRECSGGRD